MTRKTPFLAVSPRDCASLDSQRRTDQSSLTKGVVHCVRNTTLTVESGFQYLVKKQGWKEDDEVDEDEKEEVQKSPPVERGWTVYLDSRG